MKIEERDGFDDMLFCGPLGLKDTQMFLMFLTAHGVAFSAVPRVEIPARPNGDHCWTFSFRPENRAIVQQIIETFFWDDDDEPATEKGDH